MSRATELFKARGIFPARMGTKELELFEELLEELETLRRVKHLAHSYREAQIECHSSFEAEPRHRRYRRCVELDRLLGIEEDWQGVM